MPDQPIAASRSDENQTDVAILGLLLRTQAGAPWTVNELVRELGEHLEVIDGLARLYGAGLAHRCGEFVWPTHPARRFHELGGL
jgi:hypothetical protein